MWWIIILIVVALFVAWAASSFSKDGKEGLIGEQAEAKDVADDCCGAHEVCESDSLLSASDELLYYQDEELDRYRGVEANAYDDDAIEEFRDVLYTLKDNEVASWLKSIQQRLINLPEIIKEEALMIVAERRLG
ncbi:FeoB-associated Cys-rich membrane protein [bacterium]|nr:FeoB-associated Cys-rich membrane protein [bacterium]